MRKYFLSVIDTDGKSLLDCYGAEEEIILKTKGLHNAKMIRVFITQNRMKENRIGTLHIRSEKENFDVLFGFVKNNKLPTDPNRKNKWGELIEKKRDLQREKNDNFKIGMVNLTILLQNFLQKHKDEIIDEEAKTIKNLLLQKDIKYYLRELDTKKPLDVWFYLKTKNEKNISLVFSYRYDILPIVRFWFEGELVLSFVCYNLRTAHIGKIRFEKNIPDRRRRRILEEILAELSAN